MPTITAERLRELERMEQKLNALESGGVDNWDGYDFAMEEIRKEEEYEEFISDIIDNLSEIICMQIDLPAGSGCGYGIRQEGVDNLAKYLKTLNIPRKA